MENLGRLRVIKLYMTGLKNTIETLRNPWTTEMLIANGRNAKDGVMTTDIQTKRSA